MRFDHRLSPALALATSLAIACGGGDDGNGGQTVNPDGDHYQYVLSEVRIPQTVPEASMFALNIDEDPRGQTNNQLGTTLAALISQSQGALDLQGEVTAAVDSGLVLVVANVQATSLQTASGVGTWVFLGDGADPAPCTDPGDLTTCRQHLGGNGSFTLSASSPRDTLMVGQIVGGKLTGGPGSVTLEIAIDSTSDPIPIRLIGTRIEVDVSEDGLMSGKIGGAVPEEEVLNTILPALFGIIDDIVQRDCDPGNDPGMCCDAESTGAAIFGFGFDENEDCEITYEEFTNHSLIASFLSPDVDLRDDSGNFNPRTNGIKDSLSLGLGFTAVKGSFQLPPEVTQ